MKVLVATAMYPTEERPSFGTFVRTQVETLKKAGVDAEPFVLEGRSRKLMYAQAVPRLRRRLATDPVDLVHAHYSYVGFVARAQRRVPLVLTFHGSDLLGVTDVHGRTTAWSRGVAAAGRALARRVDAVIVQSDEMARQLPHLENVHVIPCEIDLDLFKPRDRAGARRELGLDLHKRYVLFGASPDLGVKRFPLARDAVARLSEVDPSVELLVVHREVQERFALYLSACDALVLTSYREGSPNIVKQAMACNLPIVATDVGDVRQIVLGTDGCHVVEPRVAAVAYGLEQLLSGPAYTTGRDHVAHLGRAPVARRLIEVYERVLSRRRNALTVAG
jgi:glycosyltransferase involved in cell wall biosynthesis